MSEIEKVLLDTSTKFGRYQVIDMIYVGREARVLFSGQRSAAQSGIPRDDNPKMLFDYNQRFLELVQSIKTKNILLIGGGAFTLPAEILKTSPEIKIDVVEQDEELKLIAEKFFGLKSDNRLRFIFDDGRKFLQKSNRKYDLILIDAFTNNVIPHLLATYEFAELIKTSLSKNGVTAINIISAYHGPNNTLIKNQYATYRQLFRHVDIYPADNTLSYWVSQNFLQISTDRRRRPSYRLKIDCLPPPIADSKDVRYDK